MDNTHNNPISSTDATDYNKVESKYLDMVHLRNNYLLRFAELYHKHFIFLDEELFDEERFGVYDIKLIGDANSPVILFNNELYKSISVKNFIISLYQNVPCESNNFDRGEHIIDISLKEELLTPTNTPKGEDYSPFEVINYKLSKGGKIMTGERMYRIELQDGFYLSYVNDNDILCSKTSYKLSFKESGVKDIFNQAVSVGIHLYPNMCITCDTEQIY